MLRSFAAPNFCGSFCKSWSITVVDDVLSCYEQEIYPATTLGENGIKFEFQKDRNLYNDSRQFFFALKLKLIKIPDYETLITKEAKKSEVDAAEDTPGKRNGRRSSSLSGYSSKQHLTFKVPHCWAVHEQSVKLQL